MADWPSHRVSESTPTSSLDTHDAENERIKWRRSYDNTLDGVDVSASVLSYQAGRNLVLDPSSTTS